MSIQREEFLQPFKPPDPRKSLLMISSSGWGAFGTFGAALDLSPTAAGLNDGEKTGGTEEVTGFAFQCGVLLIFTYP